MDFNSKYRRVAKAYYDNLSSEKQQQAKQFFHALDKDNNRTVSFHEYSNFIKQVGFDDSKSLFKLLDEDNDGKLNFEECVTLYYVAKAPPGRSSFTICNACDAYMWEIYFTCVDCYKAGKETYDLCCDCYGKKIFNHHHTAFWDNFKLLADMQPEAEERQSQGIPDGEAEVNYANTSRVGNTYGAAQVNSSDTSTVGKISQVVEAVETGQRIVTQASDASDSIANAASELCTIL